MQSVNSTSLITSATIGGSGHSLVQTLKDDPTQIAQQIPTLCKLYSDRQISSDELFEIITIPTEPGIPFFLNYKNWFSITLHLDQLDEDLLKRLVQIKTKDSIDLLTHAICNNRLDYVKRCVEAGADLDCDNSRKMNRIWGAVYNRYEEIIQYLIDQKVDINITSEDGFFPYEAVRSCRRTPSTLKVIEILKASHKSHLRSELFFLLKKIGNVYEYYGKTYCLGTEDQIELEGLRVSKFAFDVLNHHSSLSSYILETESDNSRNSWMEKMHGMLERFVFPGVDGTNQADLLNIQNGLPTFINAGYKGHSCSLIFYGDRLVVCNTSGRTDPIRYFHYNTAKISLQLIHEIVNVFLNGTEADYNKLFDERLPKELELKQTNLDHYLQNNAPELAQTSGNCPWACLSAGLYAFFTLHLVSDETDPTAKDEAEKKIKIAKNLHRKWLNFEKVSALKNLVQFIDDHEDIRSKIDWSVVNGAFSYCLAQECKIELSSNRFRTYGVAYDKPNDPLRSEVETIWNRFSRDYYHDLGLSLPPPSSYSV